MQVMENTKFQLNISKIMPTRPKNTGMKALDITRVKPYIPLVMSNLSRGNSWINSWFGNKGLY